MPKAFSSNYGPTNEVRAETKLAWAMPYEEEEDEVNFIKEIKSSEMVGAKYKS